MFLVSIARVVMISARMCFCCKACAVRGDIVLVNMCLDSIICAEERQKKHERQHLAKRCVRSAQRQPWDDACLHVTARCTLICHNKAFPPATQLLCRFGGTPSSDSLIIGGAFTSLTWSVSRTPTLPALPQNEFKRFDESHTGLAWLSHRPRHLKK